MAFTALWVWRFGFINRAVNSGLAALSSPFSAATPAGVGGFGSPSPFLDAITTMALFGLGLAFAYNASAGINALLPVGKRGRSQAARSLPPTVTPPSPEFAGVQKIGIVLAGGGAKGAFQAGAMRAIYDYLEQHGAHEKVRAICGTSIGSWNALFWLADLIKPSGENPVHSAHETFWRNISAKLLAAPSWYLPFCRNAFLSVAPWKRVFDALFSDDSVKERLRRQDIHFYFTRSDVGTGEISCVTNDRAPLPVAGVRFQTLDASAPDPYHLSLREAVFASMDIPPLFPYVRHGNNCFEDGGVIDNLPIAFAASAGCDLVFVLALNSDFQAEPNHRSVLARLFRVMNVRQGVLERKAFRDLYLYNELAVLREHALQLRGALNKPRPDPAPQIEAALGRQHRRIDVFALCPDRAFVAAKLGTHELWRNKEATEAFTTMHNATLTELPRFDFKTPKRNVRLGLVSQHGKVTWDENL